MKKIIVATIGFVLFFVNIYSQSDSAKMNPVDPTSKMFETKIYMQVDTLVYKLRKGNFYVTEDNQAMIMALPISQPLDSVKAQMQNDAKKKNVKIKQESEYIENDRRTIFKMGEFHDNGKTAVIELFAIEATPNKTILVTSVYLLKDKDFFVHKAGKAAATARIIE